MTIGTWIAVGSFVITIAGIIWKLAHLAAQVKQNTKEIEEEKLNFKNYRIEMRAEKDELMFKIEDISKTQVRIITILETMQKKN